MLISTLRDVPLGLATTSTCSLEFTVNLCHSVPFLRKCTLAGSGDSEAVGPGVCVAVGVCVGVGVCVAVAAAVGVGVAVATAVGVRLGVAVGGGPCMVSVNCPVALGL
ncbi:MAG: hypothetical protein F4Y44_07055 [Chloroflexi bacterium]|nr:hypothetical protein [Chloroflexota bacterium]